MGRHRAVRGRGSRASWLGVLLTSLLLIASTLAAPSARGQDEPIEFTITQLSPTVLGTSGELVIGGTARNISDAELRDVVVQLWRDATGIRTLSALDRVEGTLGGDLSRAPGAIAQLGDLNPGETRNFEVRASLDPSRAVEQLWLEQPDAAYLVGVEARGGRQPELLGKQRFFMAHPGPRANTEAAFLIELSSPASRVLRADGSWMIQDHRLLDELAGRIGNLMTRAEQSGYRVVVDPMLVDDIQTLANTGEIGGQRLTAGQLELATTSLTRLTRLIESGKAYRTLYGNPDAQQLVLTEQGADQLRMLAELPDAHQMAKLPLLISPADAKGSARLAEVANSLGAPTTLAVSNAQSAQDASRLKVGDVEILRVIDHASAADPIDRSQRTAKLLVAGLSQQRLALLSDDPDELAQWASDSWLKNIDLSTLSQSESADLRWDEEPQRRLNDARPEQSGHALKSAGTWAALTDRGAQLAEVRRVLLGGIWSQQWPDEAAMTAWLTQNLAPLLAYNDSGSLRLRIPDSVTTSADDNMLPVTVVSTLDVPVQLQVRFESANPQRISIPDSQTFQVRPGESTTIRVRPHSQANGNVAITAQLVTVDGQPVGEPVVFNVQATQAGRIGWIIIVVSGIVLLTTTAWRVRQVRAKQRG